MEMGEVIRQYRKKKINTGRVSQAPWCDSASSK